MISIKPDICLTMWEVFSIKKHVFGKLFVYKKKKGGGLDVWLILMAVKVQKENGLKEHFLKEALLGTLDGVGAV